ncbi:MAG: c-type cytochrome [Acidobacteriota bacterium]|nr:MAG: c-type cytochrome [Acidobacteriota bacterium]
MMAEPERDRLFEHEYDGIKEYDNPMPRWWVYLFAGSILFCFPYIIYYHLGRGPSIQETLDAEIAAYAEQLMATYGELKPDTATIVQYMDNEIAMKGMESLFKGKCAQCHVADGSGNVGPNLTDDYWLNVEQIIDIAEVLNNGRVAKGMPAWKDKLTETQIVLLSSYVARLRREPLPGKEPQGDRIQPWPQSAEPPPADDLAAGAAS